MMKKQVKQKLLKSKLFIFFSTVFLSAGAQYAPAVGQAGTTAMHQDSSAFVAWAISCEVTLGYMDVANPSAGTVSIGTGLAGEGKANGLNVVSLGDGGSAILTFSKTIKDEQGFDFAVFENSFSDDFLELAFVEVSSDGVNYVRFPSSSLTQTTTQIDTYGLLDPTKLNNLAGKYRAKYGTPFDLSELKDSSAVNINAITHVKIIDVVGSINGLYTSYDKDGNAINDPYPTPFASGGFDLDAVGVIHEGPLSVKGVTKNVFQVYPNPIIGSFKMVNTEGVFIRQIELISLTGSVVKVYNNDDVMDVSSIENGFYLLRVSSDSGVQTQKVIVKNK